MPRAELDDRYDDHRKVKAATRQEPLAAALHAQAITYCSRHETDGVIDALWLDDRLPARRREKVIAVLLELRLFDLLGAGETLTARDRFGWEVTIGPFESDQLVVHDFLDYNGSSVYRAHRRAKDLARKATNGSTPPIPPGRGRRFHADSERIPNGFQMDSARPSPAGAPAGTGVAGDPSTSTDEGLESDARARRDTVVEILSGCPRLHIDATFVGIENALAMHPDTDAAAAARLAVVRASDLSWRTTDGARALEFALDELDRRGTRAGGRGHTGLHAVPDETAERHARQDAAVERLMGGTA